MVDDLYHKFVNMLEEARTNFGEPNRKFSREELQDLRIPDPPEFELMRPEFPDHPQIRYYDDRMKVYNRGKVVWGAVIQANEALFREGEKDLPAVILYSVDDHFAGNVEELAAYRDMLAVLKGQHPGDERLARLTMQLAREREWRDSLVIPDHLTGGRWVMYTTIMVCLKHLPVPKLVDMILPVVVAPKHTPAAWILPSRYWPEAMLDHWFTADQPVRGRGMPVKELPKARLPGKNRPAPKAANLPRPKLPKRRPPG